MERVDVTSAIAGAFGPLQTALTAANLASKTTSRQNYDISKSLGLDREQKAYKSRLDALTDPKTYSANREAKWNDMVKDVKAYFDKTVIYLDAAGFGWDEAKEKAKELTAEMAKIERMKLELVFPTGANIIGAQATVNTAFSGEDGKFNPAELTAAGRPGFDKPKRASRKKK